MLLNTDDYRTKVTELLANGPYRNIENDPIEKISRNAKKLVPSSKSCGGVYDKLRPKAAKPPRIYGVPKVHKENVPLRSIVCCGPYDGVNTIVYKGRRSVCEKMQNADRAGRRHHGKL